MLSPSNSLSSSAVAKLMARDEAGEDDLQVRFNSTPNPSSSMEDDSVTSSLVVTSRKKLLQFINDQKLQGKSKRMFRRILGLCMSFLMMLTAGSLLSFNAYSETLQSRLVGVGQTQMNVILSCGNIGLLLGFTGGAMFDWKGPKYTAAIAAIMTFTGYMMLFLSVVHSQFTHYIFISAAMFVVGQGSNFSYSAALQTQLINFPPKHRGKAIGFIDSMFGGSAALFSIIYATTFGKSSDYSQQHLGGFFLFMAIFIGSINFLGIFVLKLIKHGDDFDDHSKIDQEENSLLVPHAAFSVNAEQAEVDENESVEKGPLQIIKCLDFWVFFVFQAVIFGMGLSFQGNLGFFLQAAQREDLTKLLSIVTPVLSLTLRLVIGVVSDLLLARVSRLVWISLGCALITAAWMITSVCMEARYGLTIACITMGSGYGIVACISPTYFSECWGVKNLGKNFGIIVIGIAISSLSFQAFMTYNYEQQAHGAEDCYGQDCYQLSSFIASGLCFASFLLSILFGVLRLRRRQKKTRGSSL
eukprot:TRINITY_DN6150_c0_g1_i1.p1 TRINITY_DN6150_c0_g1~~TRINITY_DN6150_c0_g1_i1.p1  ORF type:complete len:527 (-),score=96.78 TRINITY_DN6150_c0_g1_i1:1298-2878(-)